MTNGGGPPHGRKRSKKGGSKPIKAKDTKTALQRKGWLPAKAASAKGE